MARVNSIVNALMRESTNQYTHGNQDLRRQSRAQLIQNARAAMSMDTGMQALKALERANTQRSLMNNTGILSAQNDARQQIEQALNAQGGGTGNTLAGAESGASDTLNANLMNNELLLGDQSGGQYMDAMRSASGQSALENARALKGQFNEGIMQNNRALQDLRARKPLSRLEVEKQIQDMFLARKLGQAEYTTAGQGVLNARSDRSNSKAALALKKKELAASLADSKAKRDAGAYAVLYGAKQDEKGVYMMPDGKPLLDKAGNIQPYVKTQYGVGAPQNMQEAVQMLAASGFTGARYRRLAAQVLAEAQRQQISGIYQGTIGALGPQN
jgi:hypothetical protein